MRFSTLIVALALSFVIPPTIHAFQSQDLIGQWSGEYNSSANGRLYEVSWTVTDVSGERVAGVFYYAGPASYHNRETKFVGKLKGTVFSAESVAQFGGPPAQWEFTIDESGRTMSATFHATRSISLTLKKVK
jgi:hypothetical protein